MSAPRLAIVHERLTEFGGSEAVVAEFLKLWPDAELFVPLADTDGTSALRAAAGGPVTIHDSPLRRIHLRSHAPLLPLVPATMRRLPLRDRFDAVLISHHAFATQAAFATDVPAIAYVHSPARWAWDPSFRAQEAGGRAGQLALAGLGNLARRNERRAAPRLAHVIANSTAVGDRIRDRWGLPATVINPPVAVDRYTPDLSIPREDFYLYAGRLVPYKRADLAIRAAQTAGCRLVIAGEGRFRSQLESIAGAETTFLGAVPDRTLLDLYRRCRALLMPGIEDFGIVPVEAMACGATVLAVGSGGALDTVLPGITGEYVSSGSDNLVVGELAELLGAHNLERYDPRQVRAHALSFSANTFRSRIATVVGDTLRGSTR
ncbi:glycosyltransferase [Nocardia sp. NPDC088792]|uniref:glycosyltransferase n=1 Tax=Nocardia sp. NPDC088792 TaxID=3364332 RepID=UPI0037FCC052